MSGGRLYARRQARATPDVGQQQADGFFHLGVVPPPAEVNGPLKRGMQQRARRRYNRMASVHAAVSALNSAAGFRQTPTVGSSTELANTSSKVCASLCGRLHVFDGARVVAEGITQEAAIELLGSSTDPFYGGGGEASTVRPHDAELVA